MKIDEIRELLDAEILTNCKECSDNIECVFASDLVSDVLAFSKPKCLLVTALISPQIITTASVIEIPCIVIVNGKKPTKSIIEMANDFNIVIMATSKTTYKVCKILSNNGLKDVSEV